MPFETELDFIFISKFKLYPTKLKKFQKLRKD